MKAILISLLICISTIIVNGQKKLNLGLKYDSEFARYEVYVKPNFSQKDFTWGPSQITIVLPSEVLLKKINVKNVDGGKWEDNSVVYAPEIATELSFHGITTTGEKTDLVDNYESLLFYFSLPSNIKPERVRIFENLKDPKSSDKGMMGGDFRNSITDMTGKDFFNDAYFIKEIIPSTVKEEKSDIMAIVYPNIITDNKFQVDVKGIQERDENLIVILWNELGTEVYRKTLSKSNLEKHTFLIPDDVNKQGLIVKVITSKGTVSKKLFID